VRLTVRNEGGSSTTEQVVTVKSPPSANFRWVADGRRVKFTDTSWDDPQEWSWNFGDGTSSTDRSPTHRFASEGSFTVTLTVSNAAGSSAPNTQTVVVGAPPVADFSCKAEGPRLVCDGGESENAVSYRWSSPDAKSNTTPNQESTTFTYDSAGRYNVTLQVASEAGVTDEKTRRGPRVTQGRAPRIKNVDVDNREGDLVRLDADFDRGPTTWEWSVEGAVLIEGGTTSHPLFRVPTNGRYEGTVRASNEFGADSESFSFTMDTI
jgi:PKD repeat protein